MIGVTIALPPLEKGADHAAPVIWNVAARSTTRENGKKQGFGNVIEYFYHWYIGRKGYAVFVRPQEVGRDYTGKAIDTLGSFGCIKSIGVPRRKNCIQFRMDYSQPNSEPLSDAGDCHIHNNDNRFVRCKYVFLHAAGITCVSGYKLDVTARAAVLSK